jgi:ankyrin repeat protein
MKRKSIISISILSIFLMWSLPVLLAQDKDLLGKVRDNDLDAVEALLDEGANVNTEDDFMGYTPLYLAVTGGNPDMVKLLLSKGADINHQDKRTGYTPLMLALNSYKTEVSELLIEEGADIFIRGNDGATALILSGNSSKKIVELLLEKGADINDRTERGQGVFTQCVTGIISGRVSYELAEYLLSKGAEIDEVNTSEYYKGYTPLFWAVTDNNLELVNFLVSRGANVNAQAKEGKTPLSIATESGYDELASFLEANGAKQ